MTRSPLAYPLNRGADADIGGAADLQTDVMRFMAILSLCLVAIFALVQSMPMAPSAKPVPPEVPDPVAEPVIEEAKNAAPVAIPELPPEPKAEVTRKTSAEAVILTRPKRRPEFPTQTMQAAEATPVTEAVAEPIAAPIGESEGFILRFESDAALMRLVAANQVGVYAIEDERARRMTVSESRISFWDASTPNSFHEMEVSTVPLPVVDALARTGADTDKISWGVTLPGKLMGQLDGLMQDHRGGSLVIGSNGDIRLEAL
jgi:hypothetical protein